MDIQPGKAPELSAACKILALLLGGAATLLPMSGMAEPGGAGPSPADAIRLIDRRLGSFGDDDGGAAVIVEVKGEVVLRRGYGLADRQRNIPFTTDTVAQIGSLTKQFTAAAILDLAHRGEVDLGAPVTRYLPTAPEPMASVTLHQLLTHTAGLPEYCGRDFQPMPLERLLRECLAQPLLFEPGSGFSYSNAGYSLLAAVLEAVSEQPLEIYLRTRILEPNGLHRTGYRFPDLPDRELAHGYLDGEDRGVVSDRIATLGSDWWNLKGNGGMQASTEDMYRWREALRGGGRLPEAVVAQLRSPQTGWTDGVAEGYGWFFRDDGTGRVRQMSHAGSDGVFFAYFWDRPEDGVFLYFVSNSGEQRALGALREVRRILIDAFVESPSQ